MTYNGLPVYYIDLDGVGTGMDAISLVDEPAVEVDFLAFAKETPKMKFTKDDEKHIITGIAMNANMPIYRRNGDYEYYTMFTPAAIEKLVVDYSKKNLFNSVNLQHDDDTFQDGIYMIESYFINKERGIAPKEFDVEDGSYVVSYKVENEELWNEIKNSDNFKGFSIQGYFALNDEEVFQKEHEETFDEWIESFLPEKKKFDKELKTPVTVDIAETARKGKKQVKVNGVLGQIYSVGRKDGKANLIFQDNEGKWSVIELDDIKEMVQTDLSLVDWNYKDKTYQDIIEDEDNVINPTAVTTEDKISDAILNGRVVMLSYNDELEGAATGYRQCFVSSWGTTVRDNGCLRVYEYYGATRSGFNEGHWRLLLTRRIMDFRLMTEVEPITQAPPQYNQEAKAGSGKNGTMNEVIMVSPL